MAAPRKRRRSKWLALVIAAPLLLSLYVAEYGLVNWMNGKGWLSRGQPMLRVAFEPADVYMQYGLPGGELLRDFGKWCYWRGTGAEITWDEFRAIR